jgi:aryl-alcohol dehydrogenase-like predicted oxidoreductase
VSDRKKPRAQSSFPLGSHRVARLGYGAMQLAGPSAFGPPKDRAAAIAVLREAVERGVNHIDTADFYGPRVTNEILREALHPYPKELVIVTKVGAKRGPKGTWEPALTPADIARSIDDNLRSLGKDVLDVVNLRVFFHPRGPAEGSIEAPLAALLEQRRKGKVRHVGLSNVTAKQVAEGRSMTDVVCVQNHYNLAHRADDPLIGELAHAGIAFVPFFPLGGFSPLQSATLSGVAKELGRSEMQVALAWLLARSPNILLIPGTSSLAHLRENLAAADLVLPAAATEALDRT